MLLLKLYDESRSIGEEDTQGYRSYPAVDVEGIEEALLRLSRLVEEIPGISELDLNSIFTLPPGQGGRIVDARIRITDTQR